MNIPDRTFKVLTLALFIVILLPGLIREGMFMDGVQYASVSRNLADGTGSFWLPYLSPTWNKSGNMFFMEHPPLVYGIQSLFFRLLGDGIHTERIYSLVLALLAGWLISRLWKLVCREEKEIKEMTWLPVLLWIIIPLSSWIYKNNVHEATLGFFTLSSVYFFLWGIGSGKREVFGVVLSAVCVFLATFSKGFPGLFPVGIAGIHWLVYRSYSLKKAIVYTLVLTGVPAVIYFFLLLIPDAKVYLSFYVLERALYRMASEPTDQNQFRILLRVFTELIPVFAVSALVWVCLRKKNLSAPLSESRRKASLFFLLAGFSASLPLVFISVQRGFYLAPSFPFFAIASAFLLAQGVRIIIEGIDLRGKSFARFRYFTHAFLVAALIYSVFQFGEIRRDKDLLHDVKLISGEIPEGTIVGSSWEISEEWGLYFYFLRYDKITLDASGRKYRYYLSRKGTGAGELEGYSLVPLETRNYDLFRSGE